MKKILEDFMKKLLSVLFMLLFAFALISCGDDKGKGTNDTSGGAGHGDLKLFLGKYIDAMNSYADTMDKASSADDVAGAIDSLASALEEIGPKMKELQTKYPNLNNAKNAPEDLKPLMGKLEGAMKKMMGASMKSAKYATDPKVLEATKKLQEMMQKFMR